MRIAISNLAWDVAEDDRIAELLASHSVDAIDVAPGKYFPDPARATASDIERVRRYWQGRGVEITGMQSLLFGTSGLNLFGAAEVQEAMLEHLAAICRIGAGLGGTRLVFGSPKNRDRSRLGDAAAHDTAVEFFRRLGDLAQPHGVQICLEPNPTRYGANFMLTSLDTATVVEAVGHPAIRMQLDTGAIAINGEDPADVVPRYAHLYGHVHASEPDLVPLGDGGTPHAALAALVQRHLPAHVVSIEMLATKNEAHEVAVARAVEKVVLHYRTAAAS